MKGIKRLVLGFLILGMLNNLVFSAPSGLSLIPSVDVLGISDYDIELQIDGNFPIGLGGSTFTYLTQFGLYKNLEGGVDFSLAPGEGLATYNIKYLAYDKKYKVAVGIQNIVKDGNANYYLTSSKEVRNYRLHFGASTEKDNNNIFLGVDKTMNKLGVMSDYISGNLGCFCVGISYILNDNLGFLFSYNKPNDKNTKNSYTFYIAHFGILK